MSDRKTLDDSTLIKNALLEINKMRSTLATVEEEKTEPIAIVGMACRFPGKAKNTSEFWKLLSKGETSITEIPSERWDLQKYYDSDPEAAGKIYTKYGSFIKDVAYFDARFFGISPKEAVQMDPQQRLLLEVSWEALENAGELSEKDSAKQTGVFIGISNNDYAHILAGTNGKSGIDAYYSTGNSLNVCAGRVSYALGLQGPALAIDTACSSSLVALHTACQNIRNKECRQALVGGVNLILSPENSIAISRAQMLAADGKCKTFDAKADGYVRGEGCGVIVCKRLSHAIEDGNTILALIKSSAVNQDGKSSGLTVPNGIAQQRLITQALKNASVMPEDVDYVEAHGTGTSLGDPIEIRALQETYGKQRKNNNPLVVGSVKTNIGHLEAAAGIAGVIKTVLCLQNETIPPHLNFTQPNPHIQWEENNIKIPTEKISWKISKKNRTAGISSFGFSGTNAHLILEEAPKLDQSPSLKKPSHLLCLSAKSETALQYVVEQYKNQLQQQKIPLEGICYTASTGRKHFIEKVSFVGASYEELFNKLNDFKIASRPRKKHYEQIEKKQVAFLFTGQGAQYEKMCYELYNTHPVFKQTLDHCDELFKPYLNKSILAILYSQNSNSGLIHNTANTQPILFAIEYSLAILWKSWGIIPNIVLGHSIGEITAACIAGVFSLEDAIKLIAARGRLMKELIPSGKMVSVFTKKENIISLLSEYKNQVDIAAVNGLEHIVLSGYSDQIVEIQMKLDKRGIKYKELQVSHAFHSLMMKPMLSAFEKVVSSISYKQPSSWFISTVTGSIVLDEITKPSYWVNHIRSTVDFYSGLKELEKTNAGVYIEIGPKPSLLAMGRDCIVSKENIWIPSIKENKSNWETLQRGLGKLYEHGYAIDWDKYEKPFSTKKYPLPTYPFERQYYWPSKQLGTSIEEQFLSKLTYENLIRKIEETGKLSKEQLQSLPYILELLKNEFIQEVREHKTDNFLYTTKWIKKDIQEISVNKNPEKWILFIDDNGVGQSLADQLSQSGDISICITSGSCYAVNGTQSYTINPKDPNDYIRLFTELFIENESTYRGIVHTWSLQKEVQEPLSLQNFSAIQTYGCISALYVLQALVKGNIRGAENLELTFVCQNTQAVVHGDSCTAFMFRTLWAMAGVAGIENPTNNISRIDLPSKINDEDILLLKTALVSIKGEQMALRESVWYEPVLSKAEHIQENSTYTFSPEGSYLITGGLGAIGIQTALWMAGKGVKNLFLLSRNGSNSSEAQKAILQLKNKKVQVYVLKADVADIDQLKVHLERIKEIAPLKGVIHAAGVLDDASILNQNEEKFTKVIKTKAIGAWNLHQLTKSLPLEFFVCFSSMSSLFDSPGQSNYAAANGSLDALAFYRKSLGLPAITINWGPWAKGGMATKLDDHHKKTMRKIGINEMEGNTCLAILDEILPDKIPNLGVFDINWNIFSSSFLTKSPAFFSSFIPKSHASNDASVIIREGLIKKLQHSADTEKQQEIMSDYLSHVISQIMELDPSLLEKNEPLIQIGLDSLMAVRLKHIVKQDISLEINPVKFMEGISINQLTRELCINKAHGKTEEERTQEILRDVKYLSPQKAEQLLSEMDKYSENEIDSLLTDLLSDKE